MMRRLLRLQLVVTLALGAIVLMVWFSGKLLLLGRPPTQPLRTVNSTTSMNISSPAFEHNTPIPSKYTCDGEKTSPPLLITNIPPGAKSLALIVDDPDAPMGTWVHWILWNIDPKTTMIEAGSVPQGATQGRTSSNTNKYAPLARPAARIGISLSFMPWTRY